MVREREEEEREADQEEQMDSIQGRFPYDDLQLKDGDKMQQTNKARGITLRRKSAPSAVVFRSMSGGRSRSSSVLWPHSTMGRKDDSLSSIRQGAGDNSRRYIMEDPVEFAMGMQTQDRYLFLLNDLLLVAKQKNSQTYKLKIRVPLCDAWLSSCVDEVTELTRPLDHSFVIGWPTNNVVATFHDALTKERWLSKLTELIHEQRQLVELKDISLKVVLRDGNKVAQTCLLTVEKTQQAKDVLKDCMTQLNIPDSESKDYKLWLWSSKEGYYPLIGHETPFSIHVSHLRELARARGHGGGGGGGPPGEEVMTVDELREVASQEPPSNNRQQFILKQKKTPRKHSLDEASHKSMKKAKRSSPFANIFRRTGREEKSSAITPVPTGKLFCLPLASVWPEDDTPPKPIKECLEILYREGPFCQGILRKSANAKVCKELRFKVDQGEPLDEEISVHVAGYLVKDYLRSLPDPLLMEALYDQWVQVGTLDDSDQKIAHIKNLTSQMPRPNVGLLKHVLCALHQIQLQAKENLMNAYNLACCIAPSLLWHRDTLDVSGATPAVQFMIDKSLELFGPSIVDLLKDPNQEHHHHHLHQGNGSSGTDSDSYHSVLSMPETGNSDSIDSLVDRELFTGEGEGDGEEEEDDDEEEGEEGRSGRRSQMIKSHLSPSNLSRDSGLTLSDTQLYDEDCADHHPHHHHHHPHSNDPRGMACQPRSSSSSSSHHLSHHHHHHHHRSSHYGEREDEECESSYQHIAPVPPPRKRGKRQTLGGGGGGGGRGSFGETGSVGLRGRDKRHTLQGSLSSSRLLDHLAEDTCSSTGSTVTLDSCTMRSTRTLPSFSNVSEVYSQMEREDMRGYSHSSDMGYLRKSASGAHIFLDDEPLSRKCSETSLSGNGEMTGGRGGGVGDGVVFRQPSGVDSTPPHSPQSKYSFSSRDSVISDSSQSGRGGVGGLNFVSRESSIASAPQTPDTDYADRLPPWLPHLDLDMGDPEKRLAHSLNISSAMARGGRRLEDEEDEEEMDVGGAVRLSASCGAAMGMSRTEDKQEEMVPEEASAPESPTPEVENQGFTPLSFTSSSADRQSLQVPTPSLPWQQEQRSREAEDVPSSGSHLHLSAYSKSMDNLDEPEAEDATPRASPNSSSSADMLPLEIAHGNGGPPVKQMSRYSQHLAKVSPPPRVLLQSLRSPRSGKDPAPLKASHHSDIVAQVQRAGFSTPQVSVEDEAGRGSVDDDAGDEVQVQVQHGEEDKAESSPVSASSAQTFDAAKSMEEAMKDSGYIAVKPKMTIIKKEESQLSNVSSSSSSSVSSTSSSAGAASSLSSLTLSAPPSARTSPSSTGSSSHTLSGEQKQQSRPSRPPEYEEAVQRSLLLKQQEVPLEAEAEAQVEASRKAKQLFENSMQTYLQGRQEHIDLPQHRSRKTSNPGAGRTVDQAMGVRARAGTDANRSASPVHAGLLAENALIEGQTQRARTGRDPRQIYLESLQRYEQQQNTRVVETSDAKTPAEPTSSSRVNTEADSISKDDIAESSRAQFPHRKMSDVTYERRGRSDVRDSPSRPSVQGPKDDSASNDRTATKTVQISETRVQLRRTQFLKDTRPRSMLDIPTSPSLHRSFSDSADRLNMLGQRSPTRQTAEVSESKVGQLRRPLSSVFFGASEPAKAQLPARKISDAVVYERMSASEVGNPPRSSVLTSSCFYHPNDSPRGGRSSPSFSPQATSPSFSQPSRTDSSVASRVSRTEGAAGSTVGRGGARPPRSESPARRTSRVTTSGAVQGSVPAASTSAVQGSSRVSAPDSSGSAAESRPKSKLGWSVKNLAKIYAAESSEPSSRNPPPPSRGGQARTGPPPYQDPPPFRRLQDSSRMSSSSSGSNASSGPARSGSPSMVKKDGPQNADVTVEEELRHHSTKWSRARSASGVGGSGDQEAINPFTDISYV